MLLSHMEAEVAGDGSKNPPEILSVWHGMMIMWVIQKVISGPLDGWICDGQDGHKL